jgi:hypothetical protein
MEEYAAAGAAAYPTVLKMLADNLPVKVPVNVPVKVTVKVGVQ